MTKRLVISVLVSTLAVACASSSDDVTPTAAGSTTTPKGSTDPSGGGLADPRTGGLEIGFGEWAIQLEAKAVRPGPITFVVHNGGTMTHGFEIQAEGGRRQQRSRQRRRAQTRGESVRPRRHRAGAREPRARHLQDRMLHRKPRRARHGDMLTVRKKAPLVCVHGTAPKEVELGGFAFSPPGLEVQAGTEVTWTNHDPTTHTVSADAGEFDSGALDPGATFSATFTDSGQFTYMCQIHPTMKGKVTVVG